MPAWEETPEGIYILNPGSVSIPKDNSPHGYLLLDEQAWIWKRADGEAYHRLALR